ncbi:MAG: hypothetical protein ACLP9L_37865 [Thermoguttaceae bacterium]
MYAIQRRLHVASGPSLGLAFGLMLVAAGGCGPSCVPVSGKVTYEDGSLIPADRIMVVFLHAASADKKARRDGETLVDVKTGTFNSVTTLVPKDGIIRGEHKVLIVCYREGRVAPDLLDKVYADPEKTPLTADSSKSPFEFKLPRPTPDSQ